MSKKKKPARPLGQSLTTAEVNAQREVATLARLKRQQQRITDLARQLTRAVRRADVARLAAARELCADTGWDVFDAGQVAADQRQLEYVTHQLKAAIEEADALKPAAAAATV